MILECGQLRGRVWKLGHPVTPSLTYLCIVAGETASDNVSHLIRHLTYNICLLTHTSIPVQPALSSNTLVLLRNVKLSKIVAINAPSIALWNLNSFYHHINYWVGLILGLILGTFINRQTVSILLRSHQPVILATFTTLFYLQLLFFILSIFRIIYWYIRTDTTRQCSTLQPLYNLY